MRIYKELPFGGTVMGMSDDEITPDPEKEFDALYKRLFNIGSMKIKD